MDFLDIYGASGVAYRFRRWPEIGSHPSTAGNYALVGDHGRKVIAVGILEDLSRAPNELAGRTGDAEIFTRLNISRTTREAEHADIALRHPSLTSGQQSTG